MVGPQLVVYMGPVRIPSLFTVLVSGAGGVHAVHTVLHTLLGESQLFKNIRDKWDHPYPFQAFAAIIGFFTVFRCVSHPLWCFLESCSSGVKDASYKSRQ